MAPPCRSTCVVHHQSLRNTKLPVVLPLVQMLGVKEWVSIGSTSTSCNPLSWNYFPFQQVPILIPCSLMDSCSTSRQCILVPLHLTQTLLIQVKSDIGCLQCTFYMFFILTIQIDIPPKNLSVKPIILNI